MVTGLQVVCKWGRVAYRGSPEKRTGQIRAELIGMIASAAGISRRMSMGNTSGISLLLW
jgi:hypothetical protein